MSRSQRITLLLYETGSIIIILDLPLQLETFIDILTKHGQVVSAILEAIMAKDSEILKAAAKATEPTSQDNPSQDDQRQQLLEADMLAAEEAAAEMEATDFRFCLRDLAFTRHTLGRTSHCEQRTCDMIDHLIDVSGGSDPASVSMTCHRRSACCKWIVVVISTSL